MAYIFGSIWDRRNRNALNDLSKSVEYQGKSIQDLVAEGQLTPAQYAELIKITNGLVKSGEIEVRDLNEYLRMKIEEIDNKASVKSLEVISKEIDNIISNNGDGTKDSEIVNARTDLRGNSTPTLKRRLDSTESEFYLFSSLIDNTYQELTFNDSGQVNRVQHIEHGGSLLRSDIYTHEDNKITEIRTLWNNDKVTIIHDLENSVSTVLDRRKPIDLIPYNLTNFEPFTNKTVENGHLVFEKRKTTPYPKNFENGVKYGILGYIGTNTSTHGLLLNSNFTGSYDVLAESEKTGAFKSVVNSKQSGSIDNIVFMTNSLEVGTIKVKDLRVFKLTKNSQIEIDFNTMTAAELHSKYKKEGVQ